MRKALVKETDSRGVRTFLRRPDGDYMRGADDPVFSRIADEIEQGTPEGMNSFKEHERVRLAKKLTFEQSLMPYRG
jgi:hypothetical protein